MESFPNSYHWWSKESELIPRSEQVVDRNGFTRDDEPKAKQDGSGASDRASAGAKVEETKSTREDALEEELDLLKSRYVELESYYKNLEASVEIAQKNSPGLSLPTPNAKATSVCDDIDEADAAADDNAKATRVCDDIDEADAATDDNVKATSVHDDVGVPDAATDDNAKATSVCDDIDEADAATDDNAKATSVCADINEVDATADDNAKATSVHDDVGVPDAAADDNAKAMNVCDDIDQADTATYDNAKGGLEKKGDGLDEAKANQEVVSAADNGEAVKETQLPDLDENLTRDSNAPKTRIHVLKEVLNYLNQAKKPRHWFPWGNGLNVNEKFWQSLVARDATSRGRVSSPFMIHSAIKNLRTGRPSLVDQISATDEQTTTEGHVKAWCLQAKEHTSQGVYNHLHFSTVWGNPVWTGVSDVLLPNPVLKHVAWVPEPVLKHDVPFICEL
ncbi:hypothetical protein Tco_1430670 [Tanacetum coccineum]